MAVDILMASPLKGGVSSMAAEQTQETLVQKWGEILEESNYVPKIKSLSDIYPEEKSLKVKFDDIDRYDNEMAILLLTDPAKLISSGEEAIKEYIPPTSEGVELKLRIMNIPKDLRTEVRRIRSKHLGNFLSIEGVVKRASDVRPRVQRAVFECARCHTKQIVHQDDPILHEPLECPSDIGGCGRARGATRFIPLISDSTFIDTQKIEIQERPEKLRGGALAQFLFSIVEDDLTGETYPGDRIIINGVLKTRMQRKGQNQMTTFDIYLDVNSIDVIEAEFDEIEISDEEMEEIERLSTDPDIYAKLVQSISPTIYGLEIEKEALILQLFGGLSKKMPDGTKLRGDIHILLVGDPGTAKSQLLSYMSSITPRGVYASGKSATSAGLTAAAVKDETGDGRWTLEAGALVLADKGLACIDELDKMSKQDSSSMHEAMEQQRISIAKAGITATLQSRCSVLAAANPKEGRFDQAVYIYEQINIPTTLLSRFDMIFPISDKTDQSHDAKIASHILRSHLLGEMTMSEEASEGETGISTTKQLDDLKAIHKPTIDQKTLRKYVFVAKKISPVMTDSAMETLKDYYLEIRKKGEEGTVPITARQLEAFVRLAEASARGRMSSEVTIDDAERAKRISQEFFRRVLGRGSFDDWDADVINTGNPKAQRDKMKEVRKIITELLKVDPGGFSEKGFIGMAHEHGIMDSEATKIFDKMRRGGELYQSGMLEGKPLYKLVHEL